jgi:hypothetical protein
VEAAIAAIEEPAVPSFDGTETESEALLPARMDSRELSEDEFWSSVDYQV